MSINKKLLMIVSMVMTFSFSILGTHAYAATNKEVKSVSSQEQTVTNDNINNSDNTEENPWGDNTKESSVVKNTDNKNNSGLVNNGQSISNSDTDDVDKELADNEEEKEIVPHWEYEKGCILYVTKDGIAEETGWFQEKDVNPDADNDNKYYLDGKHSAVTGWKEIEGNWYYFNEKGVMQTGWQLINYCWYNLGKDGIMQKGWSTKDGYRCYLNDSGAMVIGKKYIDDKLYFFAADGRLETGFYMNNGKDYYSDSDGVMVTNQWIKTRNSRYYAKPDGTIAKGKIIIDGVLETFDNSGKNIKSESLDDLKNNYLYVRYLNVGDADCAFVKLPSGETALIDTGDVKTKEELVSFLNDQDLKKKKGKKYIDYVILTHGHSDHIGGLTAVLDEFEVGKIYIPSNAVMKDWYSNLKVSETVTQSDIDMLKYDYDVYMDMLDAVKEHNQKLINPVPGQYIDSQNILQFVQSGKDFGPIGSQVHLGEFWGINENSAVVYLNYGDFQGLFTADMEWNSEKDFWKSNLLNGREVDVLKVPHHGNNTSSTGDFLAYVKAPVGVISRSEQSIAKNEAYTNLLNNGTILYETSQSKNGGVAVYSTEENWSMADYTKE